MDIHKIVIVVLLVIINAVASDEACPKNDNTIEALPYWNQSQELPCMYSGVYQVSKTRDHNLFYWFIRNTNDPNAPLVIWFNGGPGSSSQYGLWLENGPLKFTKTGLSGDNDYVIGLNPEGSWSDLANVVYLDQPVGVGFSYGSTNVLNMEEGASDFLSFLIQFYDTYPEFKTRPLFLSGESYAGKYIPSFGTAILNYNKANTF